MTQGATKTSILLDHCHNLSCRSLLYLSICLLQPQQQQLLEEGGSWRGGEGEN